ncbi:hypothetical protein LX32DRAFT_276640 [Colletotrichum zoysiae]|uniref:Uncharacterized protein n=1 Tax=Colletotrichum zoysiae TaxID=1216348 RepID=A0AAD9LTY5_9PEZI|nr:hypothetical protein LX32DRAFT_276640 [Colletotrichum zoysiae]
MYCLCRTWLAYLDGIAVQLLGGLGPCLSPRSGLRAEREEVVLYVKLRSLDSTIYSSIEIVMSWLYFSRDLKQARCALVFAASSLALLGEEHQTRLRCRDPTCRGFRLRTESTRISLIEYQIAVILILNVKSSCVMSAVKCSNIKSCSA